LIASGFGDFNVMPEHGVLLYEMLRAQHTPAMSYFHQGGHGAMPPIDTRVKWFTRYLYGVSNGIENQAVAYPDPASQPVAMHMQSGGNAIGVFTLGAASNVTESFTDSALINPLLLYEAANSDNRLMYATSPLTQSVHLSGWPSVTLRVASSKTAANLSVYLVSLPAATLNSATVVTRGWADLQNASALTGTKRYTSQVAGSPLVPGQFYNVTFDLQPDDQVIAAGNRLAVMIFSSDQLYTLWPSAGTRLSVDLGASSVTLPVVGGATAVR
jgi:X-Pro dipeptidyl-peptidase